MKNIIKKNKIVICTIALMLMATGYLNYSVNTKNTLQAASLADSEKYGDLGDARLVSSTNVDESTTSTKDDINGTTLENTQDNTQNEDKSEEQTNNESNDSTKETAGTPLDNSTDQYFKESKIERDNMYSQMLESYQKLLDNATISETQRGIAQEEIKKINNTKNAIMITENLIKNKGISDALIFVNDKSVNIVVKAQSISAEQIAQIQNIVQRELKAEIEDIHISNK